MKVNLSVITLSLGLLILASGCSTSKMKNNNAIEGREWSLVSVQSKDGSTKLTPAEDQQPTLSILQEGCVALPVVTELWVRSLLKVIS